MSADQNAPSPDPPAVPYGAWPSPIAARDLVTGASQPIDAWAEHGVTWWSQTRPDQGGRQQLVRREADGTRHDDVLPDNWNARTRVHEYGGAAWWVHEGVVFTVDWSDQRLYRSEPGRAPVPITPPPASPAALRYTDGRLTPDGALCVCVREAHLDGDVRNEIVAVPAMPSPGSGSGSGSGEAIGEPVVLVSGPDFVAAPRISPDGARLAWIEWQHPDMPWDTTRLWTGDLVRDATGVRLENVQQVPSGPNESLIQPEWGPDGVLYVISDRSDWWNVYRVEPGGLVAVFAVSSEVGRPPWVFGLSRYQVGVDGVWLTYSGAEGAHLVRVDAAGQARDVVLPFLGLDSLRLDAEAGSVGDARGAGSDRGDGSRLVAIASQAAADPVVIEIRFEGDVPHWRALSEPSDSGLPAAAISIPRRISFPSADGRTAHALLFLPTSAEAGLPAGEKPPLLVTIHGGPTAAANPAFRLSTQYWTTRGFAVVDVDYGGSTGYGRPYRQLLNDAWGIVDVEDACAAATWLAGQGVVDPQRLAIRGGSAGGYTTLAALATKNVFAAGASHFGVADLGALARDTHKFESRYLDRLVGPWPQAEAVYTERSPLSHMDGFDRPLIVLQGDEDAVVPPAQAEAIVAALAVKQVPHSYLLFAGEQHGFRQAENIVRALEAELSFYAQVFGFEPAGSIDPVPIEFADRLKPSS